MKFFLKIILISSCLFLNWTYPYDAQDILESSNLLSCQYSMAYSQLPKNIDSNIACSTWKIPFAEAEKSDLSVSLSKCSSSMTEETQHAYGYNLCSQHLLKYKHFQNYISVLTNHDSYVEYLLVKHNNCISLPYTKLELKLLIECEFLRWFDIQQS